MQTSIFTLKVQSTLLSESDAAVFLDEGQARRAYAEMRDMFPDLRIRLVEDPAQVYPEDKEGLISFLREFQIADDEEVKEFNETNYETHFPKESAQEH